MTTNLTTDPTIPKENTMTTRTLKRWLGTFASSITIACALAMAPPALAVPVLVGTGNFNATNDLTVIENNGQTLQFLDLTWTVGMTVADAVATYSGAGFHWATGSEVAQLFEAFGITYVSAPTEIKNLFLPIGAAPAFNAYLGATSFGNSSFGWLDDNTTDTYHTLACISVSRCATGGVVANISTLWPAQDAVGVYLVRDSAAAVSEPASALLVGLGLLGVGVARRQKARVAVRRPLAGTAL